MVFDICPSDKYDGPSVKEKINLNTFSLHNKRE